MTEEKLSKVEKWELRLEEREKLRRKLEGLNPEVDEAYWQGRIKAWKNYLFFSFLAVVGLMMLIFLAVLHDQGIVGNIVEIIIVGMGMYLVIEMFKFAIGGRIYVNQKIKELKESRGENR